MNLSVCGREDSHASVQTIKLNKLTLDLETITRILRSIKASGRCRPLIRLQSLGFTRTLGESWFGYSLQAGVQGVWVSSPVTLVEYLVLTSRQTIHSTPRVNQCERRSHVKRVALLFELVP